MDTLNNKEEAMIIIRSILKTLDQSIVTDGEHAKVSSCVLKEHLQEAYEFLEKD